MKDVVYVQERVGARGGQWWKLTLKCGHTTWRRRPTSLTDKRSAFPKRAKCRSCK